MHPMRSAHARQRHSVQRVARTTDAHAFFNLLTDAATLEAIEAQLPSHRERLLPPTETLAMFLALLSTRRERVRCGPRGGWTFGVQYVHRCVLPCP